MEHAAIALLGFYALGYLILGGADIGLGMMMPFLAKNAPERRQVVRGIVPFFLGHEVWLVAAAGVLIGCFPELEGRMLTSAFPAVVTLLLGWIARDVGLWTRGRAASPAWHGFCDVLICLGSWVVALSWGVFLLWTGGEWPGGIGLLLAGLVVLLFAAHGLGYAGLRIAREGAVGTRVRQLSGRVGGRVLFALTAAAMVLTGIATGRGLSLVDGAADPETLAVLVPALLVITPLVLAAQVGMWWLLRARAVPESDITPVSHPGR
ncbi:hypothetical protein Afil01_52150 [Actinorhabdospora filicis]|uniref:Cytochrome d ubiquinol oxidase subunit II n=1 Tax=Actinorhabdospora filicis TaxID=1785913 RepID=A0A9W6WBT8_9ACTN|nr:cytochrome d ubiquinol oxidase subunit II [Actinorhabdospora filicis]GLZ80408.1 hypothetical protein Afil01_52150 [Actinorhabdospora filicis]